MWYNKAMSKLILAASSLAVAFICGCARESGTTLTMVTQTQFPPYEFMRGRELVGVDMEIGRAVAAKLGRKFRCESVDFASIIPAVLSGRADFAASGLTVTADRLRNVDFSDPYITKGVVVVYRKTTGYQGPAQLKGRKIGVQSGATSETYCLEKLRQEPAERCHSPVDAVAALKSGRVDFVIADVDPAKHSVIGDPDLAISDVMTTEEYAVAVRKGCPELLKAVNETIAEIKADGRLAKWVAEYTAEAEGAGGM